MPTEEAVKTSLELTIDGKGVQVPEGTTVLEAARQAGVEIPTVCAHEELTPYGACRLCIVEIEGVPGYPSSCTTPARDGMVVHTQTPEVNSLRQRTLELMLSGHPKGCLVCPHRTDCEEHRPRPTKAGRTTRCGFCSNRSGCSIREMSFEMCPESELDLPTIYYGHNLERFDPFMDRDYNLCVLCARCWRVCEKIHEKPAISFNFRGRWARPGTSFSKSFVESGCTFCGACIDLCPTGTLSDRFARWHGAPDRILRSTCNLCPEGCPFWVWVKNEKIVATRMLGFTREYRLCALGRFAYAQIPDSPQRLLRPAVRIGRDQIPLDWDEAIAETAEKLATHTGRTVILFSELATRETQHLFEQLAQGKLRGEIVRVPGARALDEAWEKQLLERVQRGEVTAAISAGDFLPEETLDALECVVAIDSLASSTSRRADSVLPAAVDAEAGGTFLDQHGQSKPIARAIAPPGESRPEWAILTGLAAALEGTPPAWTSLEQVTAALNSGLPPTPLGAHPRDVLEGLPARYRGHYLADLVPDLAAAGLPQKPRPTAPPGDDGGYRIIKKQEIVPNFHLFEIEAPQVARFAKPGQFAIIMPGPESERVPFTLADWDPAAGTITLIVEEVGRSSREMVLLKEGDSIAHVTGPLGLPMNIEKFGTVVLGAGCYGIGAIFPIARAMKEAGNRVLTVIEACSYYLIYWEDKLREVSDEILFATKDGSRGLHGGVQDQFQKLLESGNGHGPEVDVFVAIGCTFMMRMATEATRASGIPTYVALNPIMVDGTGMCGACRCSIGGETRFACIDGPIFNGHEVDWDELAARRSAYAPVEVEALARGPHGEGPAEHVVPGISGACSGERCAVTPPIYGAASEKRKMQ